MEKESCSPVCHYCGETTNPQIDGSDSRVTCRDCGLSLCRQCRVGSLCMTCENNRRLDCGEPPFREPPLDESEAESIFCRDQDEWPPEKCAAWRRELRDGSAVEHGPLKQQLAAKVEGLYASVKQR